MRKTSLFLLLILSFCIHEKSFTVTRSHGIGIRAGFWSAKEETFGISGRIKTIENSVAFNAPGASTSIYFFSRLNKNWFGEVTIGATGTADFTENEIGNQSIQSAGLIPILIGARYDIFSYQFGKSFHPYAGLGVGYYMTYQSDFNNDLRGNSVTANLDSKIGTYCGMGLYLSFHDRFAFNLNARYHFVGYNSNEDYKMNK